MAPLAKLDDLNEMHMDVLKEIGNIGSGSAATALATVLDTKIDLTVPAVKTLNFTETINVLGGAEELAIGILFKFTGEISGLIMYVVQTDFVQGILKGIFDKDIKEVTELTEMDLSAISEVGNIMAGSYVNAISGLSGLSIDISIPDVAIDYSGAILTVPALAYAELGDKVLFIGDNFHLGDSDIKSNMILIPEMDSLATLFGRLGIEL